ncbi:hypothetical protein BJX61DRAFT_385347 [Aspergillus egyptiacus]|nr:hypothetical protein BJX61DRAFT_385347 [Aspergillus egyptiacus]
MKLQSFALVLAACLSTSAAQGLGGLPECAQECATGAIPEECSLIDVECICAAASFVQDMACCVGQSCGPEDQDAALDYANGICGGAGITDLPQTATCASDSTTATTTTTETTTAGDEATTTTTTDPSASETATTTTQGETSSETVTETSTSTETETPTSSETPADPEGTDAAALLKGKDIGLLAAIAAGIAFLM